VQRIVGRIEIEGDLLGSFPVRVEEEIDEQRLDRPASTANLL
jgi:hypothetical protein